MFGDKKLQVYEEEDFFSIEFKWYSPGAYFFLFFTIFWNVFLIFWYSMAIGVGAGLMFILFPLIHVAVGLGLIYYTTCLFLNKTYINIDQSQLLIEHSPIPWWKGNKNIPVSDLQQIYVKESKSTGKNGATNYSYSLRAKLFDNSDKELLAIGNMESHQMQEIEEHLERFIGINDKPVKGELGKSGTTQQEVVEPRRQRADFMNSPLQSIYLSKEGDILDFKNQELDLISITQLDWKDGNSDRQFQLLDEADREELIYFIQNKALLHAFKEKSMSLLETSSFNFQKENPPKSIQVSGETYFLNGFKAGRKFVAGALQNNNVEQWSYFSNDKNTYLRIISHQDQINYYRGERISIDDFEQPLDLNQPPIPEQIDPIDWSDEDLV